MNTQQHKVHRSSKHTKTMQGTVLLIIISILLTVSHSAPVENDVSNADDPKVIPIDCTFLRISVHLSLGHSYIQIENINDAVSAEHKF